MIAEFEIVPLGKGTSLSEHVAKAVKVVQESGLDYRVTATGTIVEGSWDRIMLAIKRAHDEVMKNSERVLTRIMVDDRKGKEARIDKRVDRLEAILGTSLKK